MLKYLFAIIFVSAGFVSRSQTAFEYSESMSSRDRIMEQLGNDASAKITKYMQVKEYDSVGWLGAKLEKRSQEMINEVTALKRPVNAKGVETFRTASLKYFGNIKALYTAIKEIGYAKDEKTRQAASEKLQRLAEGTKTAIEDIKAAQESFAKANGFRIGS